MRDLRAELLRAEAAHFATKNGTTAPEPEPSSAAPKRQIEDAKDETTDDDDPEAKRRRILEAHADEDADSVAESSDDDSNEDSDEEDDEEDETAQLMAELEKIKKERAEQRAKEEAERAAVEEDQRVADIALGNPLLNAKDFNVKRRWDDDVVFKNQARGTEDKKPKEFVNDLLRSDFHKRFMVSAQEGDFDVDGADISCRTSTSGERFHEEEDGSGDELLSSASDIYQRFEASGEEPILVVGSG